jgi:hypothetical protein
MWQVTRLAYPPGPPRHRGRARRRIDLSGARQTPGSWLRHRNLRHRGGPAGVLGPELQGLQMVGLPDIAFPRRGGSAGGHSPGMGWGEVGAISRLNQGSELDPTAARSGVLATEARTLRRSSGPQQFMITCGSVPLLATTRRHPHSPDALTQLGIIPLAALPFGDTSVWCRATAGAAPLVILTVAMTARSQK